MTDLLTRLPRVAAVPAGTALVAGVGVVAGLAAPSSVDPWMRGLDVAAGVAMLVAAGLSPVPRAQRVLVGAVGVAWLAAPLLHVPLVHLSLLAAVLASFPRGRPRLPVAGLLLLGGTMVAVGIGGQIAAGTLVMIAGLVGARASTAARVQWFPVVCGVAVGGGLVCVGLGDLLWPGWADPDRVTASLALGLLGVAAGHVLTTRALAAVPTRQVASVLSDAPARSSRERHRALERLLAETLEDPSVRVWVADPVHGFTDGSGIRAPRLPEGARAVTREGEVVAGVWTRGPTSRDAAASATVDGVVALMARSIRLADERERQLAALRAARERLLHAASRERSRLGRRLESEVVPALDLAICAVDAIPGTPAIELEVVRAELGRALSEIEDVLRGVSATPLGDGRVVNAVNDLARSAPLAVTVTVRGAFSGAEEVEAACYYLCTEALTNVVKHAGVQAVDVHLVVEGEHLIVTVADRGRGGADPGGSGLRGLRDRTEAVGGTLLVREARGGGTVVSAELPRAGSAAREDPGSASPLAGRRSATGSMPPDDSTA
ncbi:sensor histidine kinase [Oryzobacter sp. R7]|uniref:sensor histidine kinase n=1 Tax=Oryzobacter faecalis TaxID=3388656 RepID=UPI00398CB2C9